MPQTLWANLLVPPRKVVLPKKVCRRRVAARVAELVKAPAMGATVEFGWLHKRCVRCGRCAVPPA